MSLQHQDVFEPYYARAHNAEKTNRSIRQKIPGTVERSCDDLEARSSRQVGDHGVEHDHALWRGAQT